MKWRSLFSTMATLTILGVGVLTKLQFVAMANQLLVDDIVIANSQIVSRQSQNLAQQSKSQLITWKQLVERGGRRFVGHDYDLPPEFRNGYVYIYSGADHTKAYIIKQGLSSYPPIKSGPREIDYALANTYVKFGKAIMFLWGGGNGYYQLHGKDTEVVFHKPGLGCLRMSCLEAPFMTNEQIRRILHSARPIPQKK